MRLAVGVALAFVTALSVARASAQPTTDRQRAETHFEAARRHVQEGRCDLAIEEFRRSLDYEPTSVGARLNLGDCYATLGRLPDAFRQYKEAEANALLRNDDRLETARLSAAQVEQRLVRVILREPEPALPGVVVTVDGASAGTRPWVIAVTPGQPHTVEAAAPDGRQWRGEVSGAAGETIRLDVELRPPSPAPPSKEPPSRSVLGPVGLATGAVGAVALATGAVFGVLAASSRGELADAVNGDSRCSGTYPDARCDPASSARLRPIEDRAFTQSTISTVSLITGGVLVAGGIVLYLLAPSTTSSAQVTRIARALATDRLFEGSF